MVACFLLWNWGLYSQEKLEVEGAIIIKNSEDQSPAPGTIRWTGSDFEGWNGQRWVSLTGYAIVGSVTDVDGNKYETARIGNQEWMVENLRVSRYNDSTTIDQITNYMTWSGLSSAAWCWYNNNMSNDVPYGKLYNWYAVNSGKLCPTDWDVPRDTEWTILTDYLGGVSIAGGKMKETGLAHWNAPNTGATNESGFTGLPGGIRNVDGTFASLENSGFWWSSSTAEIGAWYRGLAHTAAVVARHFAHERFGMSVRCVKD